MSWCKRKDPGKPPASPRHIDVVELNRRIQEIAQAAPAGTPLPVEMQVLLDACPPLRLDRWGQPLPFADSEQFRINRVAAILADPINRGRSLIRSGSMGPDEVQALAQGRVEDYRFLKEEVLRDVLVAGPPLPLWVESQLAIFYQRPVSQVLTAAEPDAPKPSAGNGGGGEVPFGTPAERREQAVREER